MFHIMLLHVTLCIHNFFKQPKYTLEDRVRQDLITRAGKVDENTKTESQSTLDSKLTDG